MHKESGIVMSYTFKLESRVFTRTCRGSSDVSCDQEQESHEVDHEVEADHVLVVGGVAADVDDELRYECQLCFMALARLASRWASGWSAAQGRTSTPLDLSASTCWPRITGGVGSPER